MYRQNRLIPRLLKLKTMSESVEAGKFSIRGEPIPPDFREQMNLEDPGFQEWLRQNEFLPDAERRFSTALEQLGLEPVTELPNGYQYLSMMEWLWLRYQQNEFFRLYPVFVRDKKSGEILFCKAKIRQNIWFGGPKKEHDVLEAMPEGVPVPKALHYVEETADTLELVVTTAAKLSESSLGRADNFTPGHAQKTVGYFKMLEAIPIAQRPQLDQKPAESIDYIFSQRLFNDSGQDVLPPEFRDLVARTLQQYQPFSEPVLIHGDGTVGNVVLQRDDDVLLIDVERGGAGYRGQDTGKLLWQLWQNGNLAAAQATLDTYLNVGDPGQREEQRRKLVFGIVFEALRQVPAWQELSPGDLQNRIREIYSNLQKLLEFTGLGPAQSRME